MRPEDLTPLWEAKERGCPKARERLIERYLCLVNATRTKRIPHAPPYLWEEMEGYGRMMLVQCVDEYDRTKGVKFPSFAITKIWGAMTEALRRDDWVTRSVRAAINRGEAEEPVVLSLDEPARHNEAGETVEWLADQIPDPARPVEQQVIEKLSREMLWGLVRCLSREEQAIVTRYYREEWTLEAIAGSGHRSESRVHQVHHRAIARLRQLSRWLGADHAF